MRGLLATLGRLFRPTLRANVVLMVLAMWGLPLAVVAGFCLLERDIEGALRTSAGATAAEVTGALERQARPEELRAELDEIAFRHTARVRLVELDEGRALLDVDRDDGDDVVHRVGTLFFGADGAPSLRELDASLPPVLARAESAAAPTSGEPETGCRSAPQGKLLVCHATMTSTYGERPVVVYVQESSRRAARALYDLRYHLARLSVAMLPIALVFSWWMGRRMVRPLDALRGAVLAKAEEANVRADLARVPSGEASDLAEAFNVLLATVAAKGEEHQAFVADLAHEIKNPAAAIRACAESLATSEPDPARIARIARILESSSTRLDHLVSQFLELARAEAGLRGEERGRVDLAALVRGVATTLEGTTTARLHLAVGPATVIGAAGRLESVVRNLLDNAASFAPAGDVFVTLSSARGRVKLDVEDSGPGIAEADLPHVFDRFFTTRARGAPGGRGGTGLGLALVKAVAEAHGGSARALPSSRGAVFRVELPAAPHAVHTTAVEASSPVPRIVEPAS